MSHCHTANQTMRGMQDSLDVGFGWVTMISTDTSVARCQGMVSAFCRFTWNATEPETRATYLVLQTQPREGRLG
jgi:hypothetical protein